MTVNGNAVVRLEGTDARMRRLVRDLTGRVTTLVRGTGGTMYASVPSQELGWVDKVAKDLGVKKTEVQTLPGYKTAPCGILTTSLQSHVGRCKRCAELRPPKDQHGKAVTVVKVEGLHDLSLEGLINFMKGKMDEALTIAQEYDTVIKAVEKIPELESQIGVLQKQVADHKQALRYFTKQ